MVEDTWGYHIVKVEFWKQYLKHNVDKPMNKKIQSNILMVVNKKDAFDGYSNCVPGES